MNELNGREKFLELLDGVDSSCQFYFIGTTNKPESLDPAILNRPSRIDNIVIVSPPKAHERLKYFTTFFTKWKEEDLKILADNTDGFSFAYLKNTAIEYIYERDKDVCDLEFLEKIIERQTKHMKDNADALSDAVNDKVDNGFGFKTGGTRFKRFR